MNQQDFIKDFESQFDELEPGKITLATELESIDEWSSLQALVIITMLDSKYKIKLTASEIQEAKTVGDMYELVLAKQNG